MSLDITIAIASDHNGVDLKDFLYHCLKQKNINVVDLGPLTMLIKWEILLIVVILREVF